MTRIELLTRDMQRLFQASEEYSALEQDFLSWEQVDDAARYLARQERMTLGLRVVEQEESP